MKSNKQKVIAIVALCISVVGLTLGFAAFSNTLTISSSATVSPDDSDFDINVYGAEIWDGSASMFDSAAYTSTTTSVPLLEHKAKENKSVKIIDNGKNVTISDISIGMIEPRDAVTYYFMIKNDGQYDAYIDTSLFYEYNSGYKGVCTPSDEATPELVEKACGNIVSSSVFLSSPGEVIETGDVYKLSKGEYIVLDFYIAYAINGDRADGNFIVEFPDLNLEFTSVPPSE